MTFILFAVHFFLAGFAQYFYLKEKHTRNPMIPIVFFGVLVGGVYLLGWWSIATFLLGGQMGSMTYIHEIRNINEED